MLKFLLFLRRIHFVLLFIALEAVAISLFLGSNIYQKAKIVGASNLIVGGVYDRISDVGSYFGLRSENERLMAELARLNTELNSRLYRDSTVSVLDSIPGLEYYQYQAARVVDNKISKRENYITINRGSADGVEPDMALVTTDGIVGYILTCSDHYAVGVSVLNTKEFRTSGRIKGSDFAGLIYWDGQDHREVVLDEIPKYAEMAVGDTVTTTEYSSRFPPDIPVGTVASFEMINGTFYKVRVRLFADLARVRHVMVVRYLDQAERMLLEETINATDQGGNAPYIETQ